MTILLGSEVVILSRDEARKLLLVAEMNWSLAKIKELKEKNLLNVVYDLRFVLRKGEPAYREDDE